MNKRGRPEKGTEKKILISNRINPAVYNIIQLYMNKYSISQTQAVERLVVSGSIYDND